MTEKLRITISDSGGAVLGEHTIDIVALDREVCAAHFNRGAIAASRVLMNVGNPIDDLVYMAVVDAWKSYRKAHGRTTEYADLLGPVIK